MKISGRRADGALYLSIGAGLAVILHGDRVSAPHDESEIERMGPWTWSPDDNTFEKRQATQRRVNLAHVLTLQHFKLAAPPPWLDKKIEGEGEEGAEKKEGEGEGEAPAVPPKKDGLFVKKEEAVALDDTEDDDKKKKPVSEIAQAAQAGEAAAPAPAEAVMNLPPPPDPAEDRKKRRGELRDKIRVGLKSQKKVEDMLADEEVSDDDLYAMAKALGVTSDEHPRAVTLVDNSVKFARLLASTTHAKNLADAGEHPFTYCKENIVPAMEKEGKAPDDPDAFCAWWKAENA